MDGTRNLLYYDVDGIPGGPLIGDWWYDRCDGEPWEIEIVQEIVWDIIESFEFVEPDPVLNPGVGVTGLPTYVAALPPEPVLETVTSPATGRVISVEFVVTTVAIEWGDGEETEIPPALYEELVGYPDGSISHIYETSTYLDPVVSFNWRVRWRVDDEPWQAVTGVEPTSWTDTYQVDEIVGRVTG
jgi:hypothetical protein